MPDGGWIPLWRKAFDCYLSPRRRRLPYTEFEAWLDLLCRAVQKPEGVMVKGVGMMPVKLEAGEILCSYRGLQLDWRWGSHHKVRRYCDALCRMEMIEITSRKPTRLKIVNAELYGLVRPKKRDTSVPEASHARPTGVPIQQVRSKKDKQTQEESRVCVDGNSWVKLKPGPLNDPWNREVRRVIQELIPPARKSREVLLAWRKATRGAWPLELEAQAVREFYHHRSPAKEGPPKPQEFREWMREGPTFKTSLHLYAGAKRQVWNIDPNGKALSLWIAES